MDLMVFYHSEHLVWNKYTFHCQNHCCVLDRIGLGNSQETGRKATAFKKVVLIKVFFGILGNRLSIKTQKVQGTLHYTIKKALIHRLSHLKRHNTSCQHVSVAIDLHRGK